MGNWIDVKEAAEMLKVSSDTLRKRIKKEQMRGRKITCHNGYKWQVYIDDSSLITMNIVESENSDVSRESTGKSESKSEDSCEVTGRDAGFVSLYEELLEEKDKRLGEQLKHMSVIESLLSDFQGRIRILESDNQDMNRQLKLLPAPPVEIKERLTRTEESLNLLNDEYKSLKVRTESQKAELQRNEQIQLETVRELDNLKLQIDKLKQENSKLEKDREKLEKAVSEIWAERDLLRKKNDETEEEICRCRKELSRLKMPWWKRMFS